MSEENTYSEAESRYFMWRWQWRRRVAIAQGEYGPTLTLKGGRVLNVFTGELIAGDVAIEAVQLPAELHADPADRMIVATARVHGWRLATRDNRLLEYGKAGHATTIAV